MAVFMIPFLLSCGLQITVAGPKRNQLTSDDRTRPRPVIKTNESLQRLSVTQLIDSLTKLPDKGVDYYTSWRRVNFVLLDEAEIGENREKTMAHAEFRELVRRGIVAVPKLLEHLDDDRETQLSTTKGKIHVGDLCYVALGQIVDEKYEVVSYPIGKDGLLGIPDTVHSPVTSKELAARLRKQWGELTAPGHRKLIQAKVFNTIPVAESRVYGALERLCVFYPAAGEAAAIRFLRRPIYDHGNLWDFLGGLTREGDEARQRKIIDAYLQANGRHVDEVLPYRLHGIYFETDFAHTKEFVAQSNVAYAILRQLYPESEFARSIPAFLNAANIEEHWRVVETLHFFRSPKVDKAIHELFLSARDFDFEARDSGYFRRFAKDCVKRLLKTQYGDTYRSFCRERIKELEAVPSPNRPAIDAWHKLLTGHPKTPP